jgi:hypothetical protein
MIVHQTTNVKIEYNSLAKQLTQTWFNFVPSDEFRKAIDFTVEYVKNNDVLSILSDTLKQRAVKPEDSEYAASVMPVLFNSGLLAMAFLIPEDIFTKMALKKFADIEIQRQHNVEYFFDLNEAQSWIENTVKYNR